MGGGALAKQLVTFGNVTALDVKRFLTPYRRSNLSVLIGIPQTWMASDASLAGEQGMRLIKKLLELTEPAYDFIAVYKGGPGPDLQPPRAPDGAATGRSPKNIEALVVNSTVTSLYAGHKALGALRQAGLLEGDRLRVVVNGFDAEAHPRHGISRREVQDALEGLPQ